MPNRGQVLCGIRVMVGKGAKANDFAGKRFDGVEKFSISGNASKPPRTALVE